MPRRRRSAHDDLRELMDAAAAEQAKLREAELAPNEAEANVDRIGAEIELAYVNEHEPLAAKHRQRLRDRRGEAATYRASRRKPTGCRAFSQRERRDSNPRPPA